MSLPKSSDVRRRPYRSAYADTTGRKRKRRFEHWKIECSTLVGMEPRLRHIGDILAKGDPYDLKDAMAAAFERGQEPMSFVQEAFAEELARAAGERLEQQEALAAMDEDDE